MTTRDNETIDERLARLAGATKHLAPPAGLAARIALRATAAGPPRGLAGVVLPFGRAALVVAALAAAAAVTLAIRSDHQLDEAVAGAEGAIWEP